MSTKFNLAKAKDAAKFDDAKALRMFPAAIARIEELQDALIKAECDLYVHEYKNDYSSPLSKYTSDDFREIVIADLQKAGLI